MDWNNEDFRVEFRTPGDAPPMGEKKEALWFGVFETEAEKLYEALGMNPSAERAEYGGPEEGSLRFYEIIDRGLEFRNPFEDGTGYISREFMNKIRSGRILMFPPGEAKPVQLSFDEKKGFRFSRPLPEISLLPKPEQPKELTGWQRFVLAVSFGKLYQKAAQEAEQSRKDYEQALARIEDSKAAFQRVLDNRTPERLEHETAVLAAIAEKKAEEKRAEERETLSRKVDELTSGTYVAELERKAQTFFNLYGPTPEYQPYWRKDAISEEQFARLVRYELPMGRGLPGTEVSPEDFAALAMIHACDPRYGGKLRAELLPNLTPEERVINNHAFYTLGAVQDNDGPPPQFGAFIDTVIQPIRQDVKDAVDAYRSSASPTPAPLAELIVKGIDFCLRKVEAKPLDQADYAAYMDALCSAAELFDRDPALYNAALKIRNKDGTQMLLPEDCLLCKGFRVRKTLTVNNEKARILLSAECREATELSDIIRKRCIDMRTKFEAVNLSVRIHIDNAKEAPAYREQLDRIGGSDDAAVKFARERFTHTHVPVPRDNAALAAFRDKAINALVNLCIPDAKRLRDLEGQALEDALKPENLFGPKIRSLFAPKKIKQ